MNGLKFLWFSFVIVGFTSVGVNSQEQDAPAKLISAPQFALPSEAIAAGIDGKVTVHLTVKKTGEVKDVKVLAGIIWPCGSNPKGEIAQVRRAITENIEAAKFSPEIRGGNASDSNIALTFFVGRIYREEMRRKASEEAAKSGKALPKLIEGGVINGKALRLPKPPYPAAARAQYVSGTVSVQVLIDEQGDVASAGAVNGHPTLQPSAREAACGAKFSPTSLQGTPVKVSGVVTYNFVAPARPM